MKKRFNRANDRTNPQARYVITAGLLCLAFSDYAMSEPISVARSEFTVEVSNKGPEITVTCMHGSITTVYDSEDHRQMSPEEIMPRCNVDYGAGTIQYGSRV